MLRMAIWSALVMCVSLFSLGCSGFDIMSKFKVSLRGFNAVLKSDSGEVCFAFFAKEAKSADRNPRRNVYQHVIE